MSVPYPMSFARATGEPQVAGELRRHPGDFVVEEDLGFEPEGVGEHVFLLIRKTGANTEWVSTRLAQVCGVREFDVTYSGRKDRHAETTQWFSVWLPGKAVISPGDIDIEGVTVLAAVRHNKKLRRGTHVANRFVVRLRDVSETGEGLAGLEARLAAIRSHGFPNYFGEQRFGRGSANLDFANRMFEGHRVQRNKQDIYLSAARSYLFNRELSRLVEAGTWACGDTGWLAGSSRKGDAVFDREPAFANWYCQLEERGIKAVQRARAVVPQALSLTMDGPDLVISFGLPRGSYATSLLRELVHYSNHSGPVDE